MIFLAALLIGLAFGVSDQYIGTLHVTLRLGWWTQSLSQMSALWLLLPFLLGSTQQRTRRAALLGFIATFGALCGYFLMEVSPAEGHPFSDAIQIAPGWLRSNVTWVMGGSLTGPLFGYLGARWRTRRSLGAAAIMAGTLMLEPLVRGRIGHLFGPSWVWTLEVISGAVLIGTFIAIRHRGAGRAQGILTGGGDQTTGA